MRRIEDQGFLLLLFVVTLAFAWILQPFYGAVLWAIVVAVIFAPVNRRILRSVGGRETLAASITVLLIIAMVLLPLAIIATSLAREAAGLYAKIQSGEYNFSGYVQRVFDALPAWATGWLDRFNLGDLSALRETLTSGLMKGGQVLAPQALSIGMNTFDFVISLGIMLYLLFFLLRDGKAVADRIREAVPLEADRKSALFTRFADVVRATVKGGVLVAMAQGALGGLAFWFLGVHAPILWAVLMAFLSLLPAIGAGLVWIPVAIYFLATGAIWQGLGLIAYGVLVIGLVDNVLRPFLVGKGTKLPDYVVLISTLGGIEVFGLNGFVIGPLIAAIFMVSWDIFATSRRTSGNDA
ncbi:AI-2E family transporter [Bradyrhizobium sp. 31Argb]|uniref:AI-2E family transporter n=1 Tax=unclassified Bradyrhizobium TaxID=2631580 RepID=UPI00102E63F3|nr:MULTISPECIES: AI-2E family transporter [unclassified Bradyrhizobium]MDI4233481.1 AI-2E family transporter [Bradyrhizobium sp. Arg237L]TAI63485.1 AI-2E family transporter [Bradyrhizobium sp. Leo170]